MAEITLYPNTTRLYWPSVVYGDGSRVNLELDPGEGWFDEDGYLRFFSVQLSDGVGNYKLLPRDQSSDTVLWLVKDFLLPFGLTVASNMIFAGNTIIENVAQELFERFGQIVVGDYFESARISNSAYYDIADGYCSIQHPLRVR